MTIRDRPLNRKPISGCATTNRALRRVTAFNRAPAIGESREGNRIVRDEIIVFEVMVEEVDRDWWKRYRENLEGVFDQDEIVVRAIAMEKI
jgi:hypothetical protein